MYVNYKTKLLICIFIYIQPIINDNNALNPNMLLKNINVLYRFLPPYYALVPAVSADYTQYCRKYLINSQIFN